MEKNYFEELNAIDVSGKIEKKNGLSYLSWSYAWAELKKRYPEATYTIYENTLPTGYVVNYFTDGKTAYVKTGVTVNGIEHIEELPVMDFRNKSIPLEAMTSFDVNKAIQRSLTKAVARHGLGLYIYAGEDLPEEAQAQAPIKQLKKENISIEQIAQIQKLGVKIEDLCAYYKLKDIRDMSKQQADQVIKLKMKKIEKQNK